MSGDTTLEPPAPLTKCADIPDLVFLAAIDTVCRERTAPGSRYPRTMASRWDIATVLVGRPDLVGGPYSTQDWPGVPPKLVLAKARKLIRRGLITGCVCGCRGDFEITEKGAQLMAAAGMPGPLGREIRAAVRQLRSTVYRQVIEAFGVPPALSRLESRR